MGEDMSDEGATQARLLLKRALDAAVSLAPLCLRRAGTVCADSIVVSGSLRLAKSSHEEAKAAIESK
jgi:hypothetical protein